MYLDCGYFNYLLNVFGLWMFEKIFCSGLCWSVKIICRFKCGNYNKTYNLFKKNGRIGLGSPRPKPKGSIWPSF